MRLLPRRQVPVDRSFGDPRARAMIQAVEAGDVDGLSARLGEARTPEERERLTSVLAGISGHAEVFDAWVQRDPENPDAWLAHGAHGVGWAWEARGRAHAEYVGDDAFTVFFERLRRAEDSLLRAAEMAPRDAVPWSHLLISGRGLQVPKEELWLRYEEAQSRHPWLPEAHLQLLQGVCDKWGGSDLESLEFAGRVAREAPDGSPVVAVVPMAHIEVWFALHMRERGNPDAYIHGPEVRQEIHDVAQRSVFAESFPDDMVTVPALNIFAYALYRMGGESAARQLVERLGERRTESPWEYLTDGPQLYAKLLR